MDSQVAGVGTTSIYINFLRTDNLTLQIVQLPAMKTHYSSQDIHLVVATAVLLSELTGGTSTVILSSPSPLAAGESSSVG